MFSFITYEGIFAFTAFVYMRLRLFTVYAGEEIYTTLLKTVLLLLSLRVCVCV